MRNALHQGVAFLLALGVSGGVFAQDDEAPEITEAPCYLPGGGVGKVVTAASPQTCGVGGCSRQVKVTLVDAGDDRLLGIEHDVGDDDSDAVTIACEATDVVLAQDGQALHFELRGGVLRVSAADRAAIARAWDLPPLKTPEAIEKRGDLWALVRLSLASNPPGSARQIQGLETELADTLELARIRDQIGIGNFDGAEGGIKVLSRRATTPSPVSRKGAPLPRQLMVNAPRFPFGFGVPPEPLTPTSQRRLAELEKQLAALRRKSAPVTLGPRRLIGGAQRLLRGPTITAERPTLFFRGGELCVVEVPAKSARWSVGSAAGDRMRCFDPATTRPPPDEPVAFPKNSGENLAYRDFTSWSNRCRGHVIAVQKSAPEGPHPCHGGPGVATEDVLAVVDGDAILALTPAGLSLVRGAGKSEAVDKGRAKNLVKTSAGTLLFARRSSYFMPDRRVAEVGGSEQKNWDVLGPPPPGAYWVGAPLVSPDERWVVAQSGNGDAPVALWLFPIR